MLRIITKCFAELCFIFIEDYSLIEDNNLIFFSISSINLKKSFVFI